MKKNKMDRQSAKRRESRLVKVHCATPAYVMPFYVEAAAKQLSTADLKRLVEAKEKADRDAAAAAAGAAAAAPAAAQEGVGAGKAVVIAYSKLFFM